MSYTIEDNNKSIYQDTAQKASIFLRQIGEEIVRMSTPITPMKTGALRRDVLKEVLGLKGKVEWRKPYAAIQEVKQFKRYTTSGTGPHFAEKAAREIANKTAGIAKVSGLI